MLLIIILAGCSAPAGSQQERLIPNRPVTTIVYDTMVGTIQGAWIAVQMPLEDLNLKQKPIPEKLQQIADNPYAVSARTLCAALRKEIGELDAALGPDVCTTQNPMGAPPPSLPWQTVNMCTPENPTGAPVSRKGEYVEKGANVVRERVVGIVSSKANILPFRGAVRYVSGADRHDKAVEKAYQAGKLRRAFLKGVAFALGPQCLNPSMTPIPLPSAMTPLPAH